jgi:hypothetical protein
MRANQWITSVSIAAIGLLASAPALAQQTTGVPGSPDATTTIDGRYLPTPDQPFQGEINLNAAQSKPAWPARVVPPKGAPNILLIMTDDVGFGAPSTFGGVIPTPALDRIAANMGHLPGLEPPTTGYCQGEAGRSHSANFDHRRRPETLRTAMAMAFFCPTNTTSPFPLVTPV